MSDTGRIRRTLDPDARRILFERKERPEGSRRADELMLISTVDLAHVVMLIERGIVNHDRGRALVRAIGELRAAGFAPLVHGPAPRGLYLAYESHLVDLLGGDVGGVLHTGRSRNDLNATVQRLALRGPYLGLLRAVLRLGALLLHRGARYADTVMPLYTHYQPALPMTLGHWCVGIASALGRELQALVDAGEPLEDSPLGAGAGGGTSVAIDPRRTAELLGFARPAASALDAVASRDHVLRLLAATASVGVLLSRFAEDLLLWTMQELPLLRLPDELVGSSSMMPQKRNPFLLEHVQGRAGAPLGAFVAAGTAMHGTPFTNSVATGTEASGQAAPALETLTEAVVLARLVLAGAEPDERAMAERAAGGMISATVLAERLVARGVPFRSAHHAVGAAIRTAVEADVTDLEQAARAAGLDVSLEGLDAASARATLEHGGGPGPRSLAAARSVVKNAWREPCRRSAERAARWERSADALRRVVAQLSGDRCDRPMEVDG